MTCSEIFQLILNSLLQRTQHFPRQHCFMMEARYEPTSIQFYPSTVLYHQIYEK